MRGDLWPQSKQRGPKKKRKKEGAQRNLPFALAKNWNKTKRTRKKNLNGTHHTHTHTHTHTHASVSTHRSTGTHLDHLHKHATIGPECGYGERVTRWPTLVGSVRRPVYVLFCFFYRVLPSFSWLYPVLLDSTRSPWVHLGFNGFYWVLPSFTGFYSGAEGCTGFY